MLCYPIQASLTAPSAWPARETQVSIVLSTGCPTRRETGLQRTCWTAAGLTHGSLERQFSPTSHTKHRKSHFSKQEKAQDFKSPGQTHQTTGTLQLVGQGCAKVSSTTFIPSIWDYSRHSSSKLGKQGQGSQLIAQLHSLPTLSKINSHHAPNLFPSLLYGSSCQRSLQQARGGCAAPSLQIHPWPGRTTLPGIQAHPPCKDAECDFKTQHR